LHFLIVKQPNHHANAFIIEAYVSTFFFYEKLHNDSLSTRSNERFIPTEILINIRKRKNLSGKD